MPSELQNNRHYLFEKSHITIQNFTNFELNLISINNVFALLFSFKKILKRHKLLILPTQFNLVFTTNQLFLLCIKSTLNLRFLNILLYSFNTFQVLYNQLMVKGNGYKVALYAKMSRLEFKIGLTHKQHILIPETTFLITIIQKINTLFFSYEKTLLGELKSVILRLKKINSYTGKGILVYYQALKKIKIVNKKTK